MLSQEIRKQIEHLRARCEESVMTRMASGNFRDAENTVKFYARIEDRLTHLLKYGLKKEKHVQKGIAN